MRLSYTGQWLLWGYYRYVLQDFCLPCSMFLIFVELLEYFGREVDLRTPEDISQNEVIQ